MTIREIIINETIKEETQALFAKYNITSWGVCWETKSQESGTVYAKVEGRYLSSLEADECIRQVAKILVEYRYSLTVIYDHTEICREQTEDGGYITRISLFFDFFPTDRPTKDVYAVIWQELTEDKKFVIKKAVYNTIPERDLKVSQLIEQDNFRGHEEVTLRVGLEFKVDHI